MGGFESLSLRITLMYFLYFIKSLKDNFIYIGTTSDISKRLIRHNKGGNVSTRYHIPYKLIYFEEFTSKTLALKRELYFKSPGGYLEKKKIVGEMNDHEVAT
jgi:putative endonuclease